MANRFGLIVAIFAGVQAIILVLCLATVQGINTTRAYVAGEDAYSKAQKEAALDLRRYLVLGGAPYLEAFGRAIAVPIGDRTAREELEKPVPDFARAYRGFVQGGNDPRDIADMAHLLRWFGWWRPFARALEDWREGDRLVAALAGLADEAAAATAAAPLDERRRSAFLARVDDIDGRLTRLEQDFSRHMGDAARSARDWAMLSLVLGSTLLGGAVGSLIGIAGGYLGGWFDLLIMRLIDMLLALPGLLLALIFIAALPRTLANEIFAIAIASVPIFARVLRGQAVQVRSRPFVDAAVVSGLRRRTIVIRHIIPNCVAPAMELATVYVGVAIVIAASLSFLGLGPSEVVPDWGTLIQSGQGYIDHDWWISVFPGVIVTLAVIALSVLGDRLRGALEPARG